MAAAASTSLAASMVTQLSYTTVSDLRPLIQASMMRWVGLLRTLVFMS